MKRDVEGFDIWRVLEWVAPQKVYDDVHIHRHGTPLASSPGIDASNFFVHHNISGTEMKSILAPSFRYTKGVETDLRKSFARDRRELNKQQAALTTDVQPIRSDDPSLRVKVAR